MMPSDSTSWVTSRVASDACVTASELVSGFEVKVTAISKYGLTKMPTASVTVATSAARMHMKTKSTRFGRFTGFFALASFPFFSGSLNLCVSAMYGLPSQNALS